MYFIAGTVSVQQGVQSISEPIDAQIGQHLSLT